MMRLSVPHAAVQAASHVLLMFQNGLVFFCFQTDQYICECCNLRSQSHAVAQNAAITNVLNSVKRQQEISSPQNAAGETEDLNSRGV